MRAGLICALALAATVTGGAARGGDLPSGGFTLADITTWLQGQGFASHPETADNGKTHLLTEIHGVQVGVYVYDCENSRCGSIQFAAGFATHGKFDTSQMNKWNRDKRWCRGYFDSEGDPWVEQDVDLTPGGSYELLNDEFHIYSQCLDNFVAMYSLK